MRVQFHRSLYVPAIVFLGVFGWGALANGQFTALASSDTDAKEAEKNDGWVEQRDEQTRVTVMTWEMTVTPKAEPRPALKYRFLPDDYERLDENAAIYYLKAMGFLEQSLARKELNDVASKASTQAQKEGKGYSQVPPQVWRVTPPAELPLKEVKEYLTLTSFQRPILREAAKREHFDMERNLHDVDDLFGYLLPEIQTMRALARTQSLRCRVAIAEGHLDDAIALLGQQYAMARHLGQDEFLVSNLVGIACAGIAWPQALYLIQHPDAPNLYWAFASLPRPTVDMRHSMGMERQFLREQLKVLDEVDEKPRPAGYWSDFIDRLIPQIGYFANEMGVTVNPNDAQATRAAIVAYIGIAYPGAREYLINEWDMPRDQVEAYPIAQVVFLAMVRFYDQWRDNTFKWTYLPFWQARVTSEMRDIDHRMRDAAQEAGFCSAPAMLLLPAVLAAKSAEARCDQQIALIQTVEAIRMYGALHDGRLPASLDDLPVPAPADPVTGKTIDYELRGDRAVLDGHALPGIRYRLVVKFAKQSK